MRFAVEQSLAYVRAKPASRVALHYPSLQVTYGDMERSLERLLHLLPFLDTAPEVLASDFRWVRIGPDFGFTGYYEPEIPASRVRKGRFQHPLYKVPSDLRRKRPYHTRHAIDCKGALKGRGLELADLVVDVGVDQRTADLFERLGDVDLCDAAFAFEDLERPFEFICQVFKHGVWLFTDRERRRAGMDRSGGTVRRSRRFYPRKDSTSGA